VERSLKLNPCPFCGSEAKLETGEASDGLYTKAYTIYDIICSNKECIMHSPCPMTYRDRKAAIKAWNRRIK
jgi:Lar family restriction alleviation protein